VINPDNRTSNIPSWRRVLLIAIPCAVLAFGIGLVLPVDDIGYPSPALLGMAGPGALFGFLTRRVSRGVILAPLLGFAGALGMHLYMGYWPHEQHWLLSLRILGCMGGLVAVVAGAIGGHMGNKRAREMGEESQLASGD